MTFQDALFVSPETRRLWQAFSTRLQEASAEVDPDAQKEFILELKAHAAERMKAHTGTEAARLAAVLPEIGDPQELGEALRQSAPLRQRSVVQQLRGVTGEAMGLLAIGVASVVAVVALVMGFWGLANPDVGIWVYPDGSWNLSFEPQRGAEQVARPFFAAASLLVGAALLATVLFVRLKAWRNTGAAQT